LLKRAAFPGDTQHLAVHVPGLVAGEEHERGRELDGLRRASHRRVLAELPDLLLVEGLHDERRPHRAGRHDVGADAALDHVLSQPLGEGDDGPLGRVNSRASHKDLLDPDLIKGSF
jgi:hypothetical protein